MWFRKLNKKAFFFFFKWNKLYGSEKGTRHPCLVPCPLSPQPILTLPPSLSPPFRTPASKQFLLLFDLLLWPKFLKKALCDTWGWCRNKLWSYAMYKIHVSKLAQLWEIVSSHSKPLGPLALTHVRLDKQTHAQERTSSVVFLCLSVINAKLWREACMFHKYLVFLFCLLFHRPLGMYLVGFPFKMCWNSRMTLKESLLWGLVHSSDSQRSQTFVNG